MKAALKTGLKKALKVEVKDAMLTVMRDPRSPPTARAMAARVLVELERDGLDDSERRPAEMTIAEIDREIASIQQRKP